MALSYLEHTELIELAIIMASHHAKVRNKILLARGGM
jgi:hypothetical protein